MSLNWLPNFFPFLFTQTSSFKPLICWLSLPPSSFSFPFLPLDIVLPEVNDVGTVEKIVVADCPRVAHIEPALSTDDLPQVGAATFKGTQDWEFFWLRFWNLRYFFVSYVKILSFYKQIFLIGPLLEEVRFFRVVLGLRGMKKNFELGQNFFSSSSSVVDPKYDPMLVFWKFNQLNAPGTTLCVDLGSKCQIIFPLVWD
jgi:hypothetical protein